MDTSSMNISGNGKHISVAVGYHVCLAEMKLKQAA